MRELSLIMFVFLECTIPSLIYPAPIQVIYGNNAYREDNTLVYNRSLKDLGQRDRKRDLPSLI